MRANHGVDMNLPGAKRVAATDADPQGRAAFTSAIVAALKELQAKKPPNAKELGQRAYQKLQYDLPLVSPEELDALADTLRASLGLKSGQPLFPVTEKLLENVVAGARGPAGAAPATGTTQSQNTPTPAADDSIGPAEAGAAPPAGLPSPPSGPPGDAPAAAAAATGSAADREVSSTSGATEPTQQSQLPSSLLDATVLGPDRERLGTAFRGLCAVIFVQLVSHCLAVSEHDTWGLLHAVGSGREEDAEAEEADAAVTETEARERLAAAAAAAGGEAGLGAERSTSADGSSTSGCPGGGQQSSERNGSYDPRQPGAANGGGPLAGQGQQPAEHCRIYDEPQATEEDGDDFVYEDLDLEVRCSSGSLPGATAARAADALLPSVRSFGTGEPTTPLPPPPPPYSWPALRARLVHLAGHVSYALLDEPGLWGDGKLREGVFQLLRALGAHRHAQELQPLLHAYVGLVADRISSEPSELDCLDSLWDAVGLQCVASLPQVGRPRGPGGAGTSERGGGGGGGGGGSGPLLVEATTCLSLVATLSGQLTGASAKLRLWQQVHRHMLPLLERCLGELARLVRPGPAAGGKQAAAQQQQPQQAVQSREDVKGPGPEEVAAIVLVCQVLDFYVQQRPGNADLAAALKGTGVLASLSVLFAAAAPLTGAEPLRSAALCCAASSRDLHVWMVAVPGVAKALAGPLFQEGGPHEAHGAVWELLGSNGSSQLALSILAGGAAPEKAVRVHALLQLLSRAAACRGGRVGALWGPAVERALRELFAALRQEQAGGAGRPTVGGEGRAPGEGGNGGAEEAVSSGGVVGAGRGGAAAAAGGGRPEGDSAGGDGAAEVRPGSSTAAEEEEEEDDKLHLLDPAALLQRRARQLHPACWRILKQLLTASGESRGKTD